MTNKNRGRSQARKPEPAKGGNRIVIVAFVAIAALLVAAIVLTGGDDAEARYGSVDVSGDNLSIYPTGLSAIADDPALGETIPTLNGEDLDGNTMTIGADGTPKAIAFLAHWCSHCQAEVPRVAQWVDETGGIDGVDIVAVTTSIDPLRGNYPPDEWLEEEGWPSAVLLDDESQSAHLAYGGGGFPFWVFVNANGEVVARTAGELSIDTLSSLMTLAKGG